MEKLCKNCSHFDYKEHICTKLESGFNYDKDKTIEDIVESVNELFANTLNDLEWDIDKELDKINGINEKNILEIGNLFKRIREGTLKEEIEEYVKDILDWEAYEGLSSVTEDDEFCCKYWR